MNFRTFCIMAMLTLVIGCNNETPIIYKTYSNGTDFKLYLGNNKISIKTPKGVLDKTYTFKGKRLTITYWRTISTRTMLNFVVQNNGLTLHCIECAKYNLPTKWEAFVMDMKSGIISDKSKPKDVYFF